MDVLARSYGQPCCEALERIVVACDNASTPENKLTFIRRVAAAALKEAAPPPTRGAVEALRELVAAQDDAYASSVSGSGRAPEAIERLASAMERAKALLSDHPRGAV